MIMWLLLCLMIVFLYVEKKSNLVQSINHILSYLYLNMKGVSLKKIHHDYSETQTKGNGINMIKDFFTINFEIKVLYMSLQKATWSPSILANEQFYRDFCAICLQ